MQNSKFFLKGKDEKEFKETLTNLTPFSYVSNPKLKAIFRGNLGEKHERKIKWRRKV